MNKIQKNGLLIAFAIVLQAIPAIAQNVDISKLDTAARNAKTNSVMFQSASPEQEMQRRAYEEELRMRREYEEEMKRRAYEEELRRREEALKPVRRGYIHP